MIHRIMSILSEFKKFALRGNLVDLAVGFTVGAAFTTIAKSLVDDILMPLIGLLLGDTDFSDRFWLLEAGDPAPPYATLADAQAAGAITLNWGLFINAVLSFLIVALAMFLVIRAINRIDEKLEAQFDDSPAPEDPQNKKCPFCRTVIPFKASRCPQCTSQLDATEDAQAQEAAAQVER